MLKRNLIKWTYAAISGLAFAFAFSGAYIYFKKSFEDAGAAKSAAVSAVLHSGIACSRMLAAYGETFISTAGEADMPGLYAALKYEPETDGYMLNSSMLNYDFGTLSGKGEVPASGIKKSELVLALGYSGLFKEFYSQIKGTAWLYYTSENGFIMLYPQAGEGFAYTDRLKEKQYYISASPESNPLRETVWSDVYIDEAGKGPMVTISSPVYRGDDFIGVVSLDYTTAALGMMIKESYDSYLASGSGVVIASGGEENYGQEVKTLGDLLGVPESRVDMIMSLSGGKAERVGGRYYYVRKLEPTPWTLVMSASAAGMALKAFLLSLPIILICLMLLYSNAETAKLKKEEIEIREMAVTDRLTGLKNRYFLDAMIEREFQLADRHNQHLSIVTFDLDHFKRVNDTWGHDIGDQVLMQAAKLAQSCVRKSDTVARIDQL